VHQPGGHLRVERRSPRWTCRMPSARALLDVFGGTAARRERRQRPAVVHVTARHRTRLRGDLPSVVEGPRRYRRLADQVEEDTSGSAVWSAPCFAGDSRLTTTSSLLKLGGNCEALSHHAWSSTSNTGSLSHGA